MSFMKTMDLREAFFKEASAIIDSDELLEEATKLLRKLRREKAVDQKPYTRKELHERIEQSLADEAAGHTYTGEEVKHMMEQKYPFLCK